MIKLINGKEQKTITKLDRQYILARGVIGKIILSVTRYLRYINAKRYIFGDNKCLLDIGCGDGYFIRHLKMNRLYGLDKLIGDELCDRLNFPDSYFDYVSMLAVIEHFENPDWILKEIHRVLKPEGYFIITTPKRNAEFMIKLYAKNIDHEHKHYYDKNKIEQISGNLFFIKYYHTFLFGLNQVFCLAKRVNI